jgi:hypothetical protein
MRFSIVGTALQKQLYKNDIANKFRENGATGTTCDNSAVTDDA